MSLKKSGKSRLSLDLHGKNVSDAVHELEYFISDAVMSGAGQVEVIHGLGTGKLQRAVHDYLKKCIVVRAFKIPAGNPGTTVVYL